MVGTVNFTLSGDPKIQCTCNHERCEKTQVKQSTLDALQKVRDDYGEPIILNSGGRCSYHPAEINKIRAGDHYEGRAVDVKCNDLLTAVKLVALAGRHGATKIGYNPRDGYLHISWARTHRKDIPTWSY